jgi:hypothetical protein
VQLHDWNACNQTYASDTKLDVEAQSVSVLCAVPRAMKLLVTNAEALRLIQSIPHASCIEGSKNNWVVSDQGNATAQSALWLFCWAKTGMGSRKAAQAAKEVFDQIFPVKFVEFDARVDHQYARDNRYSDFDLEAELAERLYRR